ncbi:PucR family transcriptional regulator [Streptomyces mirabilis]|jgi:DNA-binding PucR family transcriptional regulator|uniref:DNA-binding transcriptional regulator, PucR family n=1 Tax=Streptomyces mirabilis TaxID=68239 RepID=A0A1I2V4C6_9ACTN|nr:helix-turn-helix domain-containing protein [Streptomyces mirabilis]SFG84072.1 DNA-binding transcriptional regulator, PucR family [Streptomyces mirabilis]
MAAEHPEAAKQLSVVAANVGSHLPEVSRDIGDYVIAEIPELRGDETVIKILQASIAENVATLLHIFENDIPLDKIEGPAAALEYARRLAQRGIPLSAMVRAYRIGHWRFLQWCLDELNRQDSDEDLAAATNRRMLRVSFGYIDRVTEHVITVYQQERDHWLLSQTAARAARVRDILTEKDVDLNWAEPALGYRIRQNHLGLVAWLPTLTDGGEGLARLHRITNEIAQKLGSPAKPLFVPRDAVVSWAWLPLGSHSDVPWKQVSDVVERCDPSVHVCAGRVGYGIEGFRSTHRQAARTQELAAAAKPAPQFTDFSTVAPIALMATNIDDMRAWVWDVLGPLAVDDENSARLRETVRIFLGTGCSYTATASAQILHKNTVQYRIRKAEEILGYSVQQGHIDLEVALLAVEYLGSTLLRTSPA